MTRSTCRTGARAVASAAWLKWTARASCLKRATCCRQIMCSVAHEMKDAEWLTRTWYTDVYRIYTGYTGSQQEDITSNTFIGDIWRHNLI